MPDPVRKIAASSYSPFATELKHVYLVGNLLQAVPHPFFRDTRAEMVLCVYEPGDDGQFHWHPEVTEYEYIIEGRMGYFSVETREETWLNPGDVICVPAGACVKRIVPEKTRALALKIPSKDDKILCCHCDRECDSRIAPKTA